MKDIIPKIKHKNFTSKLLSKTIVNLRQGVVGLAVSTKKDLFLSGSRLFQSALNLNFTEQLKEEWDEFRKKGIIGEDYEYTEQSHACLQEMLNFLDEDAPDKIRFDFLKKIFIMAGTGKIMSMESILPQQYMRICRTLSTSEILILVAAFKLAKNKSWQLSIKNADVWLKTIADKSGLYHPELVDYYDQILIDKKLLTNRVHSDRSGINPGKNCRLTNLAIKISEFIETYDDLKNIDKK
jgi:hypothetical protein